MSAQSVSRADINTIKHLTHRYLAQQAMIYGGELILPKRENPLGDFHQSICRCTECGLSRTRKRLVFGSGHGNANLMLIGEAPGEEEDKQGKPFVGKAGGLLDKILHAIGFSREEIYICNILKCRPPGNRDPQGDEIIKCLPYLLKQVEIIRPRIILALGRVAAQTLLERQDPLSRMRGNIYDFHGVPLMVTYHPAALLRNSDYKRPTWEDVQKLRKMYDELMGDKSVWQPTRK